MRNIKKIFIVVFSLILLFAVSCSNDDKTGVKDNPPENDTEITDGETGSGSSSGGSSETGTGGDRGSGEGGGGTETPPSPSEPETTEPLEEKDFPPELLGDYAHSTSGCNDIQVFFNNEKKRMQMNIMFIRETDGFQQSHVVRIEKCTKTTKGGKIIKVEVEYGDYIITFDYEAKTISGTYGAEWSFSGTKK